MKGGVCPSDLRAVVRLRRRKRRSYLAESLRHALTEVKDLKGNLIDQEEY